MEAYKQQSMDAAMSDEGEEESDELLYRENPYMQMGGFNPMQQQENPQQKTEQEDSSFVPYYPNIEFFGGGQEKVFMKKGGKVSKKQFMKNVLKRFEEGGPKETPLTSAPKKDTLEKDVEKVTKGFVSAVQGKAKESVAKEMHKLAEESGDPKLQQILMSGNQQQQPKQELGGMQYADDGAIVDPGGQTYQEYIDWYNTEDPKNPFNPATESKAPPMSEEEFNAAYGESDETDIYGRTVYRDKYVPSSQNYGYGYGIRDMLFPANRFMGYRPKYYVDPRLGKPVARDVYGKTLFGGKKYIDYYEMPDEDFDPEILRRRDINKRARQGNKFLRKALKGKLDYKDILNRTSTRRGNLDDAGNDMGVDPKKPSRRERDKQGLFASDPTWNEENWKDYGKRGQRQALQDYRFDNGTSKKRNVRG